jgi:hypothetical protein
MNAVLLAEVGRGGREIFKQGGERKHDETRRDAFLGLQLVNAVGVTGELSCTVREEMA